MVPISSLALVVAPSGHSIVFDDLRTTQDHWVLGKWQGYAQSKLANLLYGRELARRFPEVVTVVVDPGPSETGLVTGLGALDKLVVYAGNVGKFLEADQGYWSQVWAVGVDRERVRSGELYEPVGVPSASYKPFCLDEKLAARLWDWTEEELKPWLA